MQPGNEQMMVSVENQLAHACEPIADAMEKVRTLLDRQLQMDYSQLKELSEHASRRRGKMLRPILLLLSGQAVGTIGPKHINLAAVVELLHQATLVHDDVLDGAQLRRKLPTASSLWGNEASVLLGDYMLSKAFDLCNEAGDFQASKAISETAGQICQGELLQCVRRKEWQMDEVNYLEIIDLKTASLYRLCCYLGCTLAGGIPEQSDASARYGQAIGGAFQIADDLLDIFGQEEHVGKTLGSDLAQAKPTLPIIHCLRQTQPGVKNSMLDLLESCDTHGNGLDRTVVEKIHALLKQNGSLQYAWAKARQLTAKAKRELEVLPDCLARSSMMTIADFVVERSW
jgi:octaprenyl-diphosphate synthase